MSGKSSTKKYVGDPIKRPSAASGATPKMAISIKTQTRGQGLVWFYIKTTLLPVCAHRRIKSVHFMDRFQVKFRGGFVL